MLLLPLFYLTDFELTFAVFKCNSYYVYLAALKLSRFYTSFIVCSKRRLLCKDHLGLQPHHKIVFTESKQLPFLIS